MSDADRSSTAAHTVRQRATRPQPFLAHHFESLEQQHEASSLGMWVFLVTEVLFFGGMFTCYVVYRSLHAEAFRAGSHHLDITLGGINTAVLIASSFTMALAVRAAQLGDRRPLCAFLGATMLLGLVFLGIKAVEYHQKFVDHVVPGPHFAFEGPHANEVEIFFSLYFAMTGLHATHMIIGLGIAAWLLRQGWRGRYGPGSYTPVENFGLYWHFVDIIWIWLFPLLYLVGRH